MSVYLKIFVMKTLERESRWKIMMRWWVDRDGFSRPTRKEKSEVQCQSREGRKTERWVGTCEIFLINNGGGVGTRVDPLALGIQLD